MQYTKLLLLLAGSGLSNVVKGQQLAPKEAVPAKPVALAEALQNSVNPRFKVLENPTRAYRQPADTLNERYVFKLGPGTRVYIKKALPQGYMITLFFGGAEEYYLPYKLVAGLPTQIEI